MLLFIKETYPPVLKKMKAKRLRKRTGDQGWYAPLERTPLDQRGFVGKHLGRPIRMLLSELPLMYAAVWTSFVYGLLFRECTNRKGF